MAFDINQYRQMLDDRLGLSPRIGGSSLMPTRPQGPAGAAAQPVYGKGIGDTTGQGPDPLPEAPETEPSGDGPSIETGEGEDGDGDDGSIDGGAPMSTPQSSRGQSVRGGVGDSGPPKIPVGPPGFKPKFKEDKLDDVKTTSDLIQAMDGKSANTYMNWWEKKYGNINDKWDQIRSQIGDRPDKDAKLTRKEKFSLLMEFGLNLMKASQPRGDNTPTTLDAVTAATHDTVRYDQQRRQYNVDKYDAEAQGIEKARGDELKTIGTYGDAMKGQAQMDADDLRGKESQAKIDEIQSKPPEVEYGDDGAYAYNRKTKQYEAVTIDGKRQTNLKVGSRGASAASKDSRTAHQKDIDDLIHRGMPEELAVKIVHKQITDPRKAWQAIYRDRRRQFDSEEDARKEADKITAEQYGDDWESEAKAPPIDKGDPLGIR